MKSTPCLAMTAVLFSFGASVGTGVALAEAQHRVDRNEKCFKTVCAKYKYTAQAKALRACGSVPGTKSVAGCKCEKAGPTCGKNWRGAKKYDFSCVCNVRMKTRTSARFRIRANVGRTVQCVVQDESFGFDIPPIRLRACDAALLQRDACPSESL